MATAKPKTPATIAPATSAPLPRRRFSRRWLAWSALVLLALGAWFWRPIHSRAVTGASYAAHIGCSCHFIEGRALSDCRRDFESGMQLVSMSQDAEAKSVTARFLLLSSQTATFREGQGCVLERWKD